MPEPEPEHSIITQLVPYLALKIIGYQHSPEFEFIFGVYISSVLQRLFWREKLTCLVVESCQFLEQCLTDSFQDSLRIKSRRISDLLTCLMHTSAMH
jgi:hypothetical protein